MVLLFQKMHLALYQQKYLTQPDKKCRLCSKIPRHLYYDSTNRGSGQIILQTALQKLWNNDRFMIFQELEQQEQLKIYISCLQQLYLNDIMKRYNFYINKESFPSIDKYEKAVKLLKYFQQIQCDDYNKADYIIDYQTQSKIHIPKVFLLQNPTPQQLSILLSPQEYILTTTQVTPKQFSYHIKGTTHVYDSGINLLNYNIYRQKLQNVDFYTDEAETYQLVKNNQFKKPILPLQYLEDSYFFNELLDINDYLVSDQILEKIQNFQSIKEIRQEQQNNSGSNQQLSQINDCLSEQINRAYNLCKTQQKNNLQFTLDKHVWNTVECIDNYNAKSQILIYQQNIPSINKHSMTNLIAQNGILVAGLPLIKKQENQEQQNENQTFSLTLKFSGRPDNNIRVQQQDLNIYKNKEIQDIETIKIKQQKIDEEKNYKINIIKFQQSKYLQQCWKIIPKDIIRKLQNKIDYSQSEEQQCIQMYDILTQMNVQVTQGILCQLFPNISYNLIRKIVKSQQSQLQQLNCQYSKSLFYTYYNYDITTQQVIKNTELSKKILESLTHYIEKKYPLQQLFIHVGKQFRLQQDVIFNVFIYYNRQYWNKISEQQKIKQQ